MKNTCKTQPVCRTRYAASGVLAVCAWALTVLGGLAAERAFEKRLVSYQQAGEPIQVSEIRKYLRAEEAEHNAEDRLLAAGMQFQMLASQVAAKAEKPLLPFGEQGRFESTNWSAETVAQAQVYLSEMREFLSAVREASADNVCYNGKQGSELRYWQIRRPFVQVVLEGNRLLCLSALVNLENGCTPEAVDDIVCAQRLSRLLS